MAHEKNDISDIVKKCKILLLDIEGTTTSISFVKDKLFPYAEENVKDFLNNEWDSDDVKDVVTALRKLALEDEEKKVEGVVTIPGEDSSKDDQIDGLVKSVKWQMSLDRKVGPLKQLQGLIWKKGYDKGDIKGHVYDDVSPALELWQSVEGQKVYIYSSGSVQAQKLLFGLSSAGDLLKFIDGHFDTAVGAKQESASYTAIAEKIGCKPEEILFLTDIDKEAEAARSAGVQAALVSREGNAPLAEAVAASFPVLYSFAELAATNKRKPDAQEQQPATKVLKTDVEADVKSSPEPEVKEAPAEPQNSVEAPTVKKSEEPEKMEVEEVAPTKEEIAEGKPTESAAKVVTIVEEVTETNEIADMPVCDIEPIIEENTEKTEQKETEKMETEVEDTTNSVSELKQNAELKNGDIVAPVPEETPPAVVTEIKDITNDKESLSEVAEVIEDLVPIVEEPPSQDMEELQNVGEVLDKECDEILSKVQDVTNLDNIPMKPLLNTIAEETMETENVDSNDIVEKILDSELELEMKQQQCADIDLNTVQEISDVTEVSEEVKGEKEEVPKTETAALAPEEKPMETEEIKVTNENIKESSHADEKVNNTAEEKDNSAAEKKDNSTAKEKINSTGEEKTNSTTEDKVNITAEDKASSTVEEKVNSNVDEKDSSSVAEKANSNLDEKVISNAEDIVNSNAEDKPNTNAEEKVNSNPEEKQNRNDEEKQNSNDEEKQNSNTEQKVEESNSTEPKVEEKMEVNEEKTEVGQENKENKMETEISTPETDDSKPKVEVNKTEENIVTEVKIDADEKVEVEAAATAVKEAPVETPTEESPMETEQSETPVETKENDKIDTTSASTQEPDSDTKETQVNGKTTNGDAGDAEMVNLNGDASKEDELTARLSMENGKEVNGANGEPNEAEKTKSENNGDEIKEVADIKVKTVAKDEPRNDPIEQPTEA